MADVSGLIIAVITVSFKVTSKIWSYCKDVKNAPKEIEMLSSEIFALGGVLGEYEQKSWPTLV